MHGSFKGTCGASGDMLETCSRSAEPLKGTSYRGRTVAQPWASPVA